MLQELIAEILQNGIVISGVELKTINESSLVCYRIDGFYKSGCLLYQTSEGIFAHTRYDQVDEITCFDDLVSLNFLWWNRSKERYDGWSVPDACWLPHLLERDLVQENIVIQKSYK